MAFSAAAVANRFLYLAERSERDITPLKMQKLVYFAHGWYLALFGEPLIGETIQAWRFGPVIGSLYRKLKEYGDTPINRPVRVVTQNGYLAARMAREAVSKEELERARAVIDKVWKEYGRFSASQLTTLTHSPDSPWSKVLHKDRPERPIPNSSIAEYFKAQEA